jgi:hypothetical protein
MASTYIDHCKETIETITTQQLHSKVAGAELSRGGDFKFLALGAVVIEESEIFLGLKKPIWDTRETSVRFMKEVAFISLFTLNKPAMLQRVPNFMALLTIEGEDSPTGILTEDLSKDGAVPVISRPVSNFLRDTLYEPFQEQGPMDTILEMEACNNNLSFDVAGNEMLLDFSPLPVKGSVAFSRSGPYREIHREVSRSLSDFTLTIPRQSALAISLGK